MNRFRRWLFNGITALSLLMSIVMAVLWARSYSYMNVIGVDHAYMVNARLTRVRCFQLRFESGHSIFSSTTRVSSQDISNPPPPRMPIGIGWGFSPYNEFGPVTTGHSHSVHTLQFSSETVDMWAFPIWPIDTLFLFLPAAWVCAAYKKRRWHARGCCLNCGYDLRATPRQCPECGTIR